MGNYWSAVEEKKEQEPTITKRVYGWKRDRSTIGDVFHSFQLHQNLDAINLVDLRKNCPQVYDQGQLGSCTANAIAGAYEFDQIKQQEKDIFVPSRLFIYYNERVIENHVEEDSGAEIKDGIICINTIGVCPETSWPYDITKFTEKPAKSCYDTAQQHRSLLYKRVDQMLEQFKQCLITGLPFLFGFQVYESFENPEVAKTGIVPMPKLGEKVLGGHAVMCVGFDDTKKVFIIRNSWGIGWGDAGYFYMPYDYLVSQDLASDFWTIQKVQDNADSPLETMSPKETVRDEKHPSIDFSGYKQIRSRNRYKKRRANKFKQD